jgi:hypothetical protein
MIHFRTVRKEFSLCSVRPGHLRETSRFAIVFAYCAASAHTIRGRAVKTPPFLAPTSRTAGQFANLVHPPILRAFRRQDIHPASATEGRVFGPSTASPPCFGPGRRAPPWAVYQLCVLLWTMLCIPSPCSTECQFVWRFGWQIVWRFVWQFGRQFVWRFVRQNESVPQTSSAVFHIYIYVIFLGHSL